MMQYKDSGGVLRPIPATGYREETRRPFGSDDLDYLTRHTYCLCDDFRKKEWPCEKYIPYGVVHDGGSYPKSSCGHIWLELCGLSKIDEIEMVNATPEDWLPALLGTLQTEMGIKELEKRLKNIGIGRG